VKNAVKIEIKFPEDVLLTLRKSKREMGKEIRKIVALQLFKERKISSGKAANLAGMCLSDFMDLTREHKIPWVEYTDEELKDEIEGAKKLAKKLRRNY
jgi:predicted HTH domain antitoxin